MSCALGATSMLKDMVLILFADITVVIFNKFHLVARSLEDVSALVRDTCFFNREKLAMRVNLFELTQPTDDTLVVLSSFWARPPLLRLPFHTLLLQLTLRGAELFQLALPPKRSESLTEYRFQNPRLSRFGAHLPMGVLPCGYGDFLCARLAAALLRLQRSLLRLRRDECLGPTAKVTSTKPHTVVEVDKTRSGSVPIGITAKTQREPYFLFIDIREPVG